MENLIRDLRYGYRMLAARPAFTVVAVLALALGIGANSAIFSVVNAVLLRPLGYNDPDRLVLIWTRFEPDLPQNWVSGPELIDFWERSTSFEGIAALNFGGASLTGVGEPEQVQGAAVTSNLFDVLGVEPMLGRTFRPEEDQPGGERVVILSHGLWQRRFGSDHNVIGQPIALDGQNSTVIGVMPADFGVLPPDAQSPRNIEIWAPVATDFRQLPRGNHGLRVIARLKPGVSLGQAKAEMDAIAEQMDKEFYQDFGFGVSVVPMLGHVVRTIRPALLFLLGAVGVVLLIACANVANLLLARAVVREKEIAVRTALGASRWRLIRQLLTESLVLSLVSGAIGLLLSYLGLKALIAMAPDNVPRLAEVSIDGRVLGFALGVSVLTGVIFGLVPAFHASKPDLNESLKEGGRGSSEGRRGRPIRLLVVAEVAMALVLLTAAGLMIKSFLSLQQVNPGFNPEKLLTMRFQLPQSRYADSPQILNFYNTLVERTRALPGVESVGTISHLPLSGAYQSGTVTVEEALTSDPQNASFEADRRFVTPDLFQAMGVALKKGRFFTDQDKIDGAGVVIIDETFARRFWPNEDPLGKRIKIGGGQGNTNPWLTIVGVVDHMKHYGLEKTGREQTYYPLAQRTPRSNFLVVRTTADPTALASSIRSEVQAIDPNLPISDIRPMELLVYSSVAQPRFYMMLLGLFAAVALTLAAVGVYGVMNYSVTQRTHEIGIRMALGADRSDIVKLVVRQGMVLVAAGVGIGLVSSFLLTRFMSSLLYGVSATDPVTFAWVALLLAVVALAASYIPAVRATKVDPMVALRYE